MLKVLVILLKVLLLVVGIGLLLGGGACMAILVPEVLRAGNALEIAPVLLIGVVAAGVGLILVVAMVRVLRRSDSAPHDGPAGD